MREPIGLLLLLIAACEPTLATPAPSDPLPVPRLAPAVATSESSSTVIQGRLAIGAPEQSSIDVEVIGPARDAIWACQVLLEKERVRSTEAGLPARIARACSDSALEPARATRPWAIATSTRFGGPLLALELGPGSEGHKVEELRARRAWLTMFTDEGSCRAAAERLARADAASADTRRAAVTSFLERSLEEQKRKNRDACAADASTECERGRELEKVLEAKLAEAKREPVPTEGAPSKCFRRE